MYDSIRIDIAGVESNMISSLKQRIKSSNIKFINRRKDKAIQLQISKPLNEESLLDAINGFLVNFKHQEEVELKPSWSFDETNSVIKGPEASYFLTKKEALFLKLLLKNDCTLTYKEMIRLIWGKDKDVTQNAMRLFTRNLRKKLPPNILKNLQGIGYRLVL